MATRDRGIEGYLFSPLQAYLLLSDLPLPISSMKAPPPFAESFPPFSASDIYKSSFPLPVTDRGFCFTARRFVPVASVASPKSSFRHGPSSDIAQTGGARPFNPQLLNTWCPPCFLGPEETFGGGS